MDTLPYHRRNYKLLEKRCLDLFSIVVIDDKNFEQPNSTYADLIHDIVPLIESLAKDLHKELAPQFPTFPQFKPKERFDYDALAFLDRTLGLSTKRVKITSELVALSEVEKVETVVLANNANEDVGNRILFPLKYAHDKDKSKHPLWSRAYQSYKHNQANMQHNSTDCPTARALLEAIGAAFLLLAVARSLPLDATKRLIKFDFTFGSELFEATYSRVLFNCFMGPLNPDCLQLSSDWKKHLFVVKDPARYIKALRAEEQAHSYLLAKAVSDNPEFNAFYNNLPENIKSNKFIMLLHLYGEKSTDPAQKEWSQKQISLMVSLHAQYFATWANEEHYQLSRFGFDPLVALNYKKAEELYDYEKLSQDEPDANSHSGVCVH